MSIDIKNSLGICLVKIAGNGLALGDVAKQSGLSSFGKIDFFVRKRFRQANSLAMIA
jgi:hypothetical protein